MAVSRYCRLLLGQLRAVRCLLQARKVVFKIPFTFAATSLHILVSTQDVVFSAKVLLFWQEVKAKSKSKKGKKK